VGLRNKRFKLRQERQKIIYGTPVLSPHPGLVSFARFYPQLALWAIIWRASGAAYSRNGTGGAVLNS
jgi:hypothetical protein